MRKECCVSRKNNKNKMETQTLVCMPLVRKKESNYWKVDRLAFLKNKLLEERNSDEKDDVNLERKNSKKKIREIFCK